MKAKRKRHDPEFKARGALEVLKGVKTIQQIAKDFDLHPVQVSEWKKKMALGVTGKVVVILATRRISEIPSHCLVPERERDG